MAADVSRDVYFEDVRLQMDAKLWGEEFNRHNPPKKVCTWLLLNIEKIHMFLFADFFRFFAVLIVLRFLLFDGDFDIMKFVLIACIAS